MFSPLAIVLAITSCLIALPAKAQTSTAPTDVSTGAPPAANAAAPIAPGTVPVVAGRVVALTIDDLPIMGDLSNFEQMREVNSKLLRTLKNHHAPATGFVVESKLYGFGDVNERIALLKTWPDAGMPLGNHGFSHLNLQHTPISDYEDDVIKGEALPRQLQPGLGKHYFRYSYNTTGSTREVKAAVELFLRERGYSIAPYTIELVDFMFNKDYVEARLAHDDGLAWRTSNAYLRHLDATFTFAEKKSREVFGREIPQVLQIHANPLNADCLDRILNRLEERGYSFVSLERAMADTAYATPDLYVGPEGLSWLQRWGIVLDKPLTYDAEPRPPKWILNLYHKN